MSSSDEKMSVEGGTEEPDAYEEFVRLSKEANASQLGDSTRASQVESQDLTSTSFRNHQMSSSETPAIAVNEDGLEDLNFDGFFNGKETPQEVLQVDEADPFTYNPFDLTQLPQTEGEVKIAVEDLTQKLRIGGLTRRNLLNRSLREFPETWKALWRPASMHTSQLSLAEMLTCVPQVDRDQFQESGDGNVNIPLYIMEKYMLPSLRIRGFMHDKTIEALPGGADTLMAYSFLSQGSD
jgi:hypothetical protein